MSTSSKVNEKAEAKKTSVAAAEIVVAAKEEKTAKVEPVKKEVKKVEPVKAEAKKAESAKIETKKEEKKAEPAKAETKKVEKKAEPAKAETKKVEKKAEPAKAETKKEAKKAPAKKTTAKKASAKKAAKPVETVQEVYFEYGEQQILAEDLVGKIKETYKSEGHRISAIKSLRVYIKPEERRAYYVINDKAEGKFVEF